MARVTVEDCVNKIPNRFELVMVAGQRARNISGGAELTVERDNDKNPVVALREIAEETVEIESLNEALIRSQQKHLELADSEEEELEVQAIGDSFTGEIDETLSAANVAADAAESPFARRDISDEEEAADEKKFNAKLAGLDAAPPDDKAETD